MANYNFISKVDPNFTCSICLDLASQPKQCEDCGKLFCSECIEKNGRKPCPNCRAKSPRYFHDVKSQRDIKAIEVHCASTERGCSWTGTIGTLDTHLTTCDFALVPCPNKCEDDKDAGELQVMRKDFDDHIKTKCLKRLVRCRLCGETGTYSSITRDHLKVCDKKIVACPNKESGCKLSVERGKTKEHVSVCEYTEVACAYESLGCGVRMLRKDIEKHKTENNLIHLQSMLEAIKSLQDKLVTQTDLVVSIAQVYKAISAELIPLPEKVKLHEELHLSLAQQVQSLSEKIKSREEQHKLLEQQVKSLSEKVRLKFNQQTLSDQVQSLSEQVGSLSIQQKTLSKGEVLAFKLTGYARKIKNKETFYSAPFYTHPGGYKMCIRVDTNGLSAGAGTHVSVFAQVLEGQYDDQLHWPFVGTVTYELLNQLADDNHHSMLSTLTTKADMQVGSSAGLHQFLPHSSLCHDPATDTRYLLDDTLFFRVSVKVDNYKPWLVCTNKINMVSHKAAIKNETLKNEEPFVFKLTGYNAWRAMEGCFISDPFYTRPGGYKMQIEVYPNGIEANPNRESSSRFVSVFGGGFVSVYVRLLKGSYDASLSWPFKGTVTFTLLNQLSDEKHYSHKLEYNGTAGTCLGYPKFINQNDLTLNVVKYTQYSQKDTLYFSISVAEEKGTKPWLTCTYN